MVNDFHRMICYLEALVSGTRPLPPPRRLPFICVVEKFVGHNSLPHVYQLGFHCLQLRGREWGQSKLAYSGKKAEVVLGISLHCRACVWSWTAVCALNSTDNSFLKKMLFGKKVALFDCVTVLRVSVQDIPLIPPPCRRCIPACLAVLSRCLDLIQPCSVPHRTCRSPDWDHSATAFYPPPPASAPRVVLIPQTVSMNLYAGVRACVRLASALLCWRHTASFESGWRLKRIESVEVFLVNWMQFCSRPHF